MSEAKKGKDAAYHREKILLCKQEEAGIQLNAKQADWKDDTDDESDDQELEAHYMYMAKLQQVSPDAVNSGPIFDTEPEQKVQNDDHYDVFAIKCPHTEQSKSVHNTYLLEQDAQNVNIETQQAATKNRGKAIVNSPRPIYDQEPSMVDDDDETSKDKEIHKLMDLISPSFKKIYKPTNNNLRTSSNTSRVNQDNSPRIHKNARYEHQRLGNVVGARETVGSTVLQKYRIQCYNCKEYRHVARECQKPKRVKDATYHREKMLLCKQEEAGIQLNAKQADWKDDTDDEFDDQELEAHYMYMAKLQLVSPDVIDSGPIFDKEPEEKIDQNDEDADLTKERELLASLIEKLKCEIDETKNRNTILEISNKVLVEKLESEIEDFKNKNKSLTEANNKLSKENDLLYADFKKSKAELKRRDSIEYATKMELACAKVIDDFLSYKMESEKSCNKYTQTINDLNQT
nr:hypothetical protein [Tanacetum cinerariifolium]